MTFEDIVMAVTPERCITITKVVGLGNLGLGVVNLIRWNPSQLGLNIASVGMCLAACYLFREAVYMGKQNELMEELRIKLEADLWDLQHGKPVSDQ